MRSNSFIAYSKNTLTVIKRAQALQTRAWLFAEQRQTLVVHQTIGNNKIKWTSSQLETVHSPDFAKLSAAYKQAFKIRKNGQNTHFKATLPLHAANR